MPNQPNMYRNVKKDAEKIFDEIKECAVISEVDSEGKFKGILGYDINKAKEIRDQVSGMRGKLELLIKGLEKNSKKMEEYERLFGYFNDFLEVTKNY